MRLSGDERRLLAGYVKNVDLMATTIGFQKLKGVQYDKEKLIPFVESGPQVDLVAEVTMIDFRPVSAASSKIEQTPEAFRQFFDDVTRLNHANELLRARGLLGPMQELPDSMQTSVALTVEGYTLGKKLLTPWGRLDYWFRSHKDGPFGILFSVGGGVIGGCISSWIIHRYFGK